MKIFCLGLVATSTLALGCVADDRSQTAPEPELSTETSALGGRYVSTIHISSDNPWQVPNTIACWLQSNTISVPTGINCNTTTTTDCNYSTLTHDCECTVTTTRSNGC